MLETIIGLLHSAWTVWIALYAFLVQDTYDGYYLSYILLLTTSWLLMKDECLVTYVYKKWSDPSYVMGTDGMDLADGARLWGKDLVWRGIAVLMVFTVISIAWVSRRSAMAPTAVWMTFVACFTVYLLTLRDVPLKRRYWEPWNPLFRTGFLAVTLVYLWFVVAAMGNRAHNGSVR